MKRFLMGVLALLLVFTTLAGCGAKPAFSLTDKGLELAAAMSELAGSEAYRTALSASSELRDTIAGMAGDYSSPKAVYAVTLPEGTMRALLDVDGELPSALTTWFEGRACASIGNRIAARQGAPTLAAVAGVSYGGSFVYAGLEKPAVYIYQYEGDYCVAVSFVPGDDGAVSASANFAPSEDALRLAASAVDVQAWLEETLGFEVKVESVL